jgi:hypothetical protein
VANLNIAIQIAAKDMASGPIGKIQNALGGLAGVGGKAGGALGNIAMLAGGAALTGVVALGGGLAAAGAAGLSMNSQMENVTAQLNAFTKDGEKSAEILEMIRKRAAATPFAFEDMATATAGLLPAAKASGAELEELVGVAEILAASNPAQGLEGAAFALREAVSGDFTSIIERFNLPRKYINDLKEQGVPALEAVQMAMQEMGFDADLVSNLAETAGGRWSTFLDTLQNIAATVTQPIFDAMSDGLAFVNELLAENEPLLTSFATMLAGAVAEAIENILALVSEFGPIVAEWITGTALPALQEFGNWFVNVGWPAIQVFAEAVLSQLVPGLQQLGIWILQLGQAMLPVLSSAFEFLTNNMNIILPVVAGIGAVLLALASPITALIGGVVLFATAWANNWGGIQEKTAAVLDFLQPYWDRLTTALTGFYELLLPRLQETWQTLVMVWQTEIQPALAELWAAFGTLFEALGIGTGDVDFLSVALGALKLGLLLVLLAVEGLTPFIHAIGSAIRMAADQFTGFINTLTSMKRGLDAIIGPLQAAADKIGELIAQAMAMPDWLIPGSPTPFELGLRGIGSALNALPEITLPTMSNGNLSAPAISGGGLMGLAAPAAGGSLIGSLVIYANDEAGGKRAAEAFMDGLRSKGLR